MDILSTISPRSKVITSVMASSCSGIWKSIRLVLSSCMVLPLTCSCNRTLCGSGILDFGMNLLSGRNPLYPVIRIKIRR